GYTNNHYQLRKKESEYPPNVRDNVRRAYLLNGPYQPDIEFPQTKGIEEENRKFVIDCYKEFTWIEYIIEMDASFCGSNIFMATEFENWKKKQGFRDHVGGPTSAPNQAYRKGQDLLNQSQHIETVLQRQSFQARSEYRVRLKAFVDCVRFLLKQELAFRVETTNVILKELGDAFFSVLIDESRDISVKKQMAVVIRFVDAKGCVIERFLGIVHVKQTTALLKATLEKLFLKHEFSIGRLRGQGYDGASNMRGQFGGLKTLIMNENESAYYVHCFPHQLQLALVGVAKNHPRVALLFNLTSNALNIVGVSCNRRDLLREKHTSKVIQKIQSGDILSGQGLNQETTLNFILMHSSVIDVLEIVIENALTSEQRGETCARLDQKQCFEFIFNLHLMKDILGITGELSRILQREYQEIVNAMTLVKVTKQRLNAMRNDGWDSFFVDVSSFCVKNDIIILNIDDPFVERRRSRRRVEVQLFIIDLQNQKLENRFNEVNTELLLCMVCVSPRDSFVAFDKEKLIRLAQFYPRDFSSKSLMLLSNQLETYILDVRFSNAFSELKGIGDLAKEKWLRSTRKNTVYLLVYMLMALALILPVATADISETIDDEAIMQLFQKMATRRGQL
ncbi:hypothetical protein AQUCO_01000674v1, partial [Aquilegia coerulea]